MSERRGVWSLSGSLTCLVLLVGCDTVTEPVIVVPDYSALCAAAECGGHGTCCLRDDEQPRCTCHAGYAGAACDLCDQGYHRDGLRGCSPDRACADERENPCGEMGTCSDVNGVIECECKAGYAGARCTLCDEGFLRNARNECESELVDNSRCTQNTCHDHGACDEVDGEVVCTCDAGYAGARCGACAIGYERQDGDTCGPARSCYEGACNGHGDCSDESGEIECDCDPGWVGSRCTACSSEGADEDLCSAPPCDDSPIGGPMLFDFEDNAGFPEYENNCSNGVVLGSAALSFRAASPGGMGWACSSHEAVFGLASDHVYLEVTSEAPGELVFGGPVDQLRFDYAARTALDLEVVVADDAVEQIVSEKGERKQLSLTFAPPVTGIELRSRSVGGSEIALDNIFLRAPPCTQ